jgi:hypothetical protein
MGFLDEIRAHNANVERKLALVQDGVDAEVFRSVVDGSEITGAPGQPIGFTGKMHDSWKKDDESPTETLIWTDDGGAPAVEGNWGNVHFKNHGPYSLAQTIAGFQHIVDIVGQKVADNVG